MKEQFMLKIKRFTDAEAMVIGFEELMHNENEAEINPHGLMERSSHKANQRPGNTLGALICSGHNGVEFKIGSGFSATERKEIWDNQDKFKMQLVKYKYQPHGVKEAPRSPIFLGFRNPADM
jgi:DNA ligase-1